MKVGYVFSMNKSNLVIFYKIFTYCIYKSTKRQVNFFLVILRLLEKFANTFGCERTIRTIPTLSNCYLFSSVVLRRATFIVR